MKNKLIIALALFGLLTTSSSLSAHGPHEGIHQHPYCLPCCAQKCQRRFPDTCIPILRKIRATRRAHCEYRCTWKSGSDTCPSNQGGFDHYGTCNASGFRINESCHVFCNATTIEGTRQAFRCNAACHNTAVIYPSMPAELRPR